MLKAIVSIINCANSFITEVYLEIIRSIEQHIGVLKAYFSCLKF